MLIKIDYSDLKRSAKYIDKAADCCDDYAEDLQRSVPNKLDDLPRGSSQNTSSASYFANAKIRALKSQETQLRSISNKIENFVEEAKSTDKRVAAILKREGNQFRKANGLSYGWADGFMEAIVRFSIQDANKNAISRWIADRIRDAGKYLDKFYLDFKHWYACDGGKYVFQAIFAAVLVIAAVTAAVAAIIVAWPIILGTSTVALLSWGGIVAVSTMIASVIAAMDAIVNLKNKINACSHAKEDPAWAARYADINSMSEYLKKTLFDSKFGNILSNYAAVAIDVVSTVCEVISIVNIGVNGYKFFTNSYRANANWKRHFKMWDSKGNFSVEKLFKNWKKNLEGFKYAFNHDFQYTQLQGARKRNVEAYKFMYEIKEAKLYKDVKNLYSKFKDGVTKFEEYAY